MEIEQATGLTTSDIAGRTFSSEISAEVPKPYHRLASDSRIATMPVPAFKKDYGFDESDFENMREPDSVLFTLVKDTNVYGYAHASKSWNNMVVLDGIALDVSVRGLGYGWQLLKEVIEWAQRLGVAGIRVETQSNNVAACSFYKKCGFRVLAMTSSSTKAFRNMRMRRRYSGVLCYHPLWKTVSAILRPQDDSSVGPMAT